MINLIFGLRGRASVLAHVLPHCVIGLTLPPIDANTFFIKLVGLSDWLEKRVASCIVLSERRKPYLRIVSALLDWNFAASHVPELPICMFG